MRDERTFLHFEDHRTRFQALEPMPGILGDVDAYSAFFLTKHDALPDRTVVMIGRNPDFPSEQDKCLILGHMMMHSNLCPHLQRIQKAMALILQRLMEVVIHPQPRRSLRLLNYLID